MNRPYGNGRLKFLGNYQITLHSGLLFKFPPTMDGCSFSFFFNTWHGQSSNSSHSNRQTVLSDCVFKFLYWASFHVLTYSQSIFSGDMSTQRLYTGHYWAVCFIIIKFWGFFIYSGNKVFIRHNIYKYFLNKYGLSFHTLNKFLKRA